MADEQRDAYPNSRPAREARGFLARALAALQSEPRTATLDRAVEYAAAASSSLYAVETELATVHASNAGVRSALEQLGEVLVILQEVPDASPAIHSASESIAHTLAVLYPLLQAAQRRRKDVVMRQVDPLIEEAPKSRLPRAPAPLGRPRLPSPMPAGRHRHNRTHRVFVEADIGLYSASNFYTGISQDLSTGGVFIATYQPQPAGTPMTLYFELPDGAAVRAEGVVRWTRDASGDAPPGMGVEFERLTPEDLAAIARFCSQRPPLYHDD